jgi:hypothetical protein
MPVLRARVNRSLRDIEKPICPSTIFGVRHDLRIGAIGVDARVVPSLRSPMDRWSKLFLGVWALTSCGEPPVVIVAHDPARSADASDASPQAQDGSSNPQRSRPSVVGGTIVTDAGSLLRGFTIAIDTNPSLAIPQTLFDDAANNGLNTVLVYLENWADVTGKNAAQADQIVAEAAKARLYVILAIGGGLPGNGHPGNGWFDIEKVRSFWNLYAPRFAAQTHVLYEVQNQPETACSVPFQQATIDMEREAFGLIRGLAPATPILLFSYRSTPDPATLTDALDRVGGAVDWSNTAVAVDADINCSPPTDYPTVLAAAKSHNAPMIFPAMPVDGWEPYLREFEKDHVSWVSTRWLIRLKDWTAFQSEMTGAQISWCPDFGSFPEPSLTCGHKP